LLIIFMITAPIMQGGVDVRLPRAQVRAIEQKQGLVVTVDADVKIYLDQAALSYDDFEATFPAFVRTKRPTGVYLRADGRVADARSDAPRGRATDDVAESAAPGREAVHGQRRRHRQYRGHRISVSGVLAEHRGAGPKALAAAERVHATRS